MDGRSQADTVQLDAAIALPVESDAIAPFATAATGDRYTAGPLLGSGGMGAVHSHLDRATGRSVAMKTMHAATDGVALRRFAREARIQSQLEHPSIVPVYDIGTRASVPYITMKHVRGESLAHVITRLRAGDEATEKQFTRRKLLTLLSSVALTIEYAHQRGVIHRDLKPENIMLGSFGEVYVLDWGLAAITAEHELVAGRSAAMRAVSEADSQPITDTPGSVETATGSILGTPGYIAPELLADGAEATPASDVYALGAILYEILTTERMNRGDSLPQTLGNTLALDGANVRDRIADIAPELDTVCRAATRKEPGARTPSAGDFARALEAYLDGDRDMAQRRTLARKVTDRVAAAVAGNPNAATRSAALREITIALGLDPEDVQARALLVRLLTEPPPDADRLAEEVGRPDARAAFRLAARTHMLVQTSYLLYIPLLAWMGVREWWMFAAGTTAITAVFVASAYYYRHPPTDLQMPLGHLLLSLIALASGAFLFGPLILVPGIVVATGVAYLANFDRRVPWIVAGTLAVVIVPTVLGLAGVIPPSYEFADGRITVLPMMTDLPPVPTAILLVSTHAITIVASMYFAWKLRSAYSEAARALRLQAWQLSQLVPEDARPG